MPTYNYLCISVWVDEDTYTFLKNRVSKAFQNKVILSRTSFNYMDSLDYAFLNGFHYYRKSQRHF